MKKQRTTQQRKIIEEICFSVRTRYRLTISKPAEKNVSTLNRVTIYRNLNRMVEAGELTRFTHPEKVHSTNKPTALIIIISFVKPVKPHLNSRLWAVSEGTDACWIYC